VGAYDVAQGGITDDEMEVLYGVGSWDDDISYIKHYRWIQYRLDSLSSSLMLSC
jgi:hypothetical protein